MKFRSVLAAAQSRKSNAQSQRPSPPGSRRALFAVNTVKPASGLLLFRRNRTKAHGIEVLLAHAGGPFFATKDAGVWGVAKSPIKEGESPLAVAKREFQNLLGSPAPTGPVRELGFVHMRSGTMISAWAIEADFEPCSLHSNDFELEWPPGSGEMERFVEVDRVEWFDMEEARNRMTPAQMPFLQRLLDSLTP